MLGTVELLPKPSAMSRKPTNQSHIDIHDRAERERWAHRFGVTDERLRKAVRMVGARSSSVAAYLDVPKA